MEFFIYFFSFIVGGVLVFIIKNIELQKYKNSVDKSYQRVEEQYNERLADIKATLKDEKEKSEEQRSLNSELNIELSILKTQNDNIKEQLVKQKAEQKDIQDQMAEKFENLAQKILKSNTIEFAESNQQRLNNILNPFKESINKFEQRIVDINEKRIQDQSELKVHLKTLQNANIQITEEAKNLTRALKGDVKKQGNWGELILSKVLESSGLTKGVEYDVEQVLHGDGGKIYRPDAIVYLPEKKHIIIDSKVSLIAYNNMMSANNDQIRESALQNHLISIKTHIDNLSTKSYQLLEGVDTPDFVLLFMPIESAFGMAIKNDVSLFNYAWDRNIVIVSPTTLLATLKTIASIWQQEKQTQNALAIAKQGGLVYDTMASFLKEYEKIGTQLNALQNTYESADKKLSSGRQSLLKRIDKLKQMGAKASKSNPEKYTLK